MKKRMDNARSERESSTTKISNHHHLLPPSFDFNTSMAPTLAMNHPNSFPSAQHSHPIPPHHVESFGPTATTSPPSSTSSTSSLSVPSPRSSPLPLPSKVESLEVGWLFVQEYYTFLNKDPSRLHCFYNKKSFFLHGHEGEKANVCHGGQVN